MFDSQGLPDYPPARNAWEFPPPPVAKRWKVVAIAATTVSATVAIGLLTTAIVFGVRGSDGLIEDSSLVSLVSDECKIMTSTVESMPITGSRERQADTIKDQNRAVELMLKSIRRNGAAKAHDDKPAEAWLQDWDRLLAARASYASDLRKGHDAELEIPLDPHGDEIYWRMDDAWLDEPPPCEVPEVLLYPYPDTSKI